MTSSYSYAVPQYGTATVSKVISVYDGDTLEYVLKVNNNSNLSMRDAMYRVKGYFDRNEVGEIEINK